MTEFVLTKTHFLFSNYYFKDTTSIGRMGNFVKKIITKFVKYVILKSSLLCGLLLFLYNGTFISLPVCCLSFVSVFSSIQTNDFMKKMILQYTSTQFPVERDQ